MATIRALLDEYQESHRNPLNKRIHMVCVPLIEWSLLGILWSLPVPTFFGGLNWAIVFMALVLLYYTQFKNLKVILAAVFLLIPFWIYVSFSPPHILETSIAVFVIAWIGQFYGHNVEGKKPSFFRDIFFLLIGPLWIIERVLNSRGKSLC